MEAVERLQEQYDEAVQKEREQFYFEGQLLYTQYAKYLLEYLKSKAQ